MKIYLVWINKSFYDIGIKLKSKYNLASFYFLRKEDFIKDNDILLDSGAFSFLKSGKSFNHNEYIEEYINYIKKHDIKKFIELDLYDIIGIKETEKIRNKMEKEIGVQTIPVFHKSLGKDYFLKLIQEYSYVAIGGFAIKTFLKKDYAYISWFLKQARKTNCKIHGLGFTGSKDLQKYPFYSVDSSTWAIHKYGELSKFDAESGQMLRIKRDKKLNVSELNNIYDYNITQWVNYQNYAENNL